MNEFFNQKITFLIGYIVIILTLVQGDLLKKLGNLEITLLGFVVPIYHLIYFHLSLLGFSIFFYSLYFIKENKLKLTRTLGEIFYAISFIIVLTFLITYLIKYIIYYLSNFLTIKFLILLVLIIIIIAFVHLCFSSARYIKNLALNIKADLTYSKPINKLKERKSYLFVKYLTDKFMSIIIIWSVLPILIYATILIFSQTRTKVIFKQIRIGKNAKRFKLLKFITMKENKDGRQLIKLGKFLRTTFTDELPQIFNLFKGDLSLVGPWPMLETEFEKLGDDSFKKLYTSVKPGLISLTSLIYYWQDLNESDRHKIETFYIINRNMKLDLRILLTSVLIIIFSKSRRN